MADKQTKGGKKGRKIGRNTVACARYRSEARAKKARRNRMLRTLRNHPGNLALARQLMTEGVPKQVVTDIIHRANYKATAKLRRNLNPVKLDTHAEQCHDAELQRRHDQRNQRRVAALLTQFANKYHGVMQRELLLAGVNQQRTGGRK